MKKLIIFGMLMLTTLFGQVKELTGDDFEKATKRGMVVVEFYAGWNEANIVKLLDEWDNFEVKRVYRLNIETYPKIQTSQNIVVLPTPDGPNKETISPCSSILRFTLLTLFFSLAIKLPFCISKK